MPLTDNLTKFSKMRSQGIAQLNPLFHQQFPPAKQNCALLLGLGLDAPANTTEILQLATPPRQMFCGCLSGIDPDYFPLVRTIIPVGFTAQL